MGPQSWKGEAIADLHEILFRPGSTVFSPKPYARQNTQKPGKLIKLDSQVYSSVARSFLDDKNPSSANYFKGAKLPGPKKSNHHGDHASNKTFMQSSKEKSPHLPKRKMDELLPAWLVEPARKGGLCSEIVKTIWGPTPRRKPADDEKLEESANELIHKLRKKKGEADNKVVETLMDVLLRSWVYFEHAHESIKSICNHVHAKYCEGKFGQYLLGDGTQLHGSFVISLRQLITELKSLMTTLKTKVIHTAFQKVPVWESPPLEEILDFRAPEEIAVPRLYPIEGLLPVPKDDIPLDVNIPLLRTPSLKPHPPYIKPKFTRKAAVLHIPPLEDFIKDERSLEPYKEIPPPIFNPPEPLPLPVWQEPQEEPLPSMPVMVETKALQIPQEEIIPPYEMAKVEPRPCEASYYTIEQGQDSICDGLCGRQKKANEQSTSAMSQHACLARSPRPLEIPYAPIYTMTQTPTFQPPKEEPLPPFIQPALILEPPYIAPPKPLILEWVPPAPPPPLGYLAGSRPVFLVDCSATMAGERMTCVQNAIRQLFSRGGQVEITATDFDIIMYSFDAWSFGALEEDRKQKENGAAPRSWVKSLEFMQPKTHENMEKAVSWMLQWRTGGTSNLKKAIEVAMQRTSADCIYLLTHGKCDRPVIIMNALKELENERNLTPIYPVGIEPTKSQARILKNILADITGGQYMELDLKWQYNLHKEQTENLVPRDMKWLADSVENWQRQNVQRGMPEKVDTILTRLKQRFDVEIREPQIAEYRKEEEKASLQHKHLLDAIRQENRRAIELAQEAYNTTHALILERNRKILDDARKLWQAEVEKVRALNQQKDKLYNDWQAEVLETRSANKKSRADAQRKFIEDVKSIADRYAHAKMHGRQEYDAMVARIREKKELILRNYKNQQEKTMSNAKMNNEANWKDYEEKCAQIRALNATNLENARRDFAVASEQVVKENQRRMKEAEEDHKWRFEVVTNENAKRKTEYMAKVDALHVKKVEARKTHQLRVSELIEEHKKSIASVSVMNHNLEQEAKRAWEESCKLTDEENKRITHNCYEEWKEATRLVYRENEERARRRIDLQLRKEEVERMNIELVRKKKMDWKETCRQMQEEYLEETERAKIQYDDYVKEMQIHNAQLLEEAKISYEAEVAEIKAYNESIRPDVEASEIVEKEINRIQGFLGYIVSQNKLPHEKKSNEKRSLEQSLAMLANLDSPCPPKVIIDALQVAYAGDLKRQSEMFFEASKKNGVGEDANLDENIQSGKKRQRGRFSGMKQIHPPRVPAHHCANLRCNVDDDKIQHSTKPKKDATMTGKGPREVPTGNVAPLFLEEKVERRSSH